MAPTPEILPASRTDIAEASSRSLAHWPVGMAVVALLLPWIFLWNGLRTEWSVNEQYGYGWFVPPFALLLFCLRLPDLPMPRPPAKMGTFFGWIIICLALLAPLRLIQIPNPDWRSASWLQAILCALLSVSFLWAAGGKRFALHFAFPLLFLFTAVPWPSEIEEPLVQSLMRTIAGAVAETMNLLGIPAQQTGNLIQIRGQMVGVNEACSGIRSLQTTLMAGLLLGELRRLSGMRRIGLLVGGFILALFANYLRSGVLVWIAGNEGVAALEKWHDLAGMLVLVAVVLGLYLISSALHTDAPSSKTTTPASARPAFFPTSRGFFRLSLLLIVGVLLGEGISHAWYSADGASTGVAPWSIRAPTAEAAYAEIPIDNRTRSYLRYDRAIAANWKVRAPEPAACTLFFLRWEAGRTSAIRATMHQPHICLTAIGMKEEADYGILPWTFENGLELPVREYIFEQKGRRVHVFYVVWREGLAGQVPNPTGNRWDRLEGVWQHQRNPATQTLELVVAGPKDREGAQAVFREQMTRLLQQPSL